MTTYKIIKRLFDAVLSLLLGALLSPLLGAIALAVRLDSPGPALFRQKRVGKDKTHFSIAKFRTMRTDTPKDMPTHKLSDAESHITKVGSFLRRTSLDELPQLLNIFKGEMSFVGPRPALWNQFDLIAERDRYCANSAVPGLTGWAQINGRDELPIPEKARLDGEYMMRRGLLFDLYCIFRTVAAVISEKGYAEGGASNQDQG